MESLLDDRRPSRKSVSACASRTGLAALSLIVFSYSRAQMDQQPQDHMTAATTTTQDVGRTTNVRTIFFEL